MTTTILEPDQLLRMRSNDIVALGARAARAGEAESVQACIEALAARSRTPCRRGLSLLRLVPASERSSRGGFEVRQDGRDGTEPTPAGDEPTLARRPVELLEQARFSIWLSCQEFPDDELVDILEAKAQAGLEVRVFVCRRLCSGRAESMTRRRLERAGVVWVTPRSNHSKSLVVDERYLMNTATKSHRAYRDYCVVHRDRSLVQAARDQLGHLQSGHLQSGHLQSGR